MIDAILEFFRDNGWDMLRHTLDHIELTFVAVLAATLVALPLGVYLTRCRRQWLVSSVLGIVGMIQTIPGLALLALIMVIFVQLKLEGVGAWPALVTLLLYALLPILRNAYTGIREVDPSVTEVARGMGMRPRQILLRVELPLSLPVIMAGLRIATVWTIGIATLCSLVGGGGLGVLIFRGLSNMNTRLLLAGTLPACLLALVSDYVLGVIEKWLTPAGVAKQPREK